MRLVLVDHVDEVLREALAVGDPDAVFGPPKAVMEYRHGELLIRGAAPEPAEGTVPQAAEVLPTGVPQPEHPGP